MQTKSKVRVQAVKKDSFKNDRGETVNYAKATVIDEEGKVFETGVDLVECGWLVESAPVEGIADMSVFHGKTKEGKEYLKMRINDFTNA